MQPNHEFVEYLGYCQFLMCMAASFVVLQAVALATPKPAVAKPVPPAK